MFKKMKKIPVSIAIVVMIVCILTGIVAGNKKALDKAIAQNGDTLTEIATMSEKRAQKAGNLLVLANRILPGEQSTEMLADAVTALKNAKRPTQLAEANRTLTFTAEASYDLLAENANELDRSLAKGVMDDLYSTEKQLARVANAYNANIQEAQAVYKKLPAQWLLGGPPEAYK